MRRRRAPWGPTSLRCSVLAPARNSLHSLRSCHPDTRAEPRWRRARVRARAKKPALLGAAYAPRLPPAAFRAPVFVLPQTTERRASAPPEARAVMWRQMPAQASLGRELRLFSREHSEWFRKGRCGPGVARICGARSSGGFAAARACTHAHPLLTRRGVSEQSERSERSEFRAVGHETEQRRVEVGPPRARPPHLSAAAGPHRPLPHRPWKSSAQPASPSSTFTFSGFNSSPASAAISFSSTAKSTLS